MDAYFTPPRKKSVVLSETLPPEEWGRRYNTELEKLRNTLDIVGLIKNRRVERVGDVVRMRWPKKAMNTVPIERRSARRPRKRRTDGVQEDLRKMHTWENWQRLAEDEGE